MTRTSRAVRRVSAETLAGRGAHSGRVRHRIYDRQVNLGAAPAGGTLCACMAGQPCLWHFDQMSQRDQARIVGRRAPRAALGGCQLGHEPHHSDTGRPAHRPPRSGQRAATTRGPDPTSPQTPRMVRVGGQRKVKIHAGDHAQLVHLPRPRPRRLTGEGVKVRESPARADAAQAAVGGWLRWTGGAPAALGPPALRCPAQPPYARPRLRHRGRVRFPDGARWPTRPSNLLVAGG
jgi:hypothetical protein